MTHVSSRSRLARQGPSRGNRGAETIRAGTHPAPRAASVLAGLAALVLCVAGAALAQEGVPLRPDTPEQAAKKVLAALGAKDDAALKALAARDQPDPWLVADELLLRGKADEAEAFARAGPRVDTEKLPAYVAVPRGKPTEPALTEALARVESALAASMFEDALSALDAAKADGGDVVAVRLAFDRGLALRKLQRIEDSMAPLRASATAAEAIGWASLASKSLHEGGIGAYATGDFKLVLELWGARLPVEERRGNRAGIAQVLTNLSAIHMRQGDPAKALPLAERAVG